MKRRRVVVLGASERPDRDSHQAILLLRAHGHEVIPVHPTLAEIGGLPVARRTSDIQGPVNTVTIYVRPEISRSLSAALVALRPQRVLFNPETESAEWTDLLHREGIEALEA